MVKDIATVLIRMLAAYLVFSFLYSAFWTITQTLTHGPAYVEGAQMARFLHTSFLAAQLACGVVIWVFAPTLANFAAKDAGGEIGEINSPDIVEAGSFLIGLYWLLSSLSSVPFYTSASLSPDGSLDLGSLSYPTVSIVLAALVMVGARRIGRLFVRLRRL